VPGPSRPRWGWHRLTRPWARRLVADAAVRPGELLLDLGAGAGALTEWLVAAGADVVAVELHPDRCRELRRRFRPGRVTVVRADLAHLRLPRRPFRVVANPPFATTSAVLRRLVTPGSRLVEARLVVPRHVARRWTGPGAPGAGRWQREFSARTGGGIPRSAFRPPPPHDAVVLVIARRPRPP
jgi:23S rRNA (adenine-N6)-dimethyltransferase